MPTMFRPERILTLTLPVEAQVIVIPRPQTLPSHRSYTVTNHCVDRYVSLLLLTSHLYHIALHSLSQVSAFLRSIFFLANNDIIRENF